MPAEHGPWGSANQRDGFLQNAKRKHQKINCQIVGIAKCLQNNFCEERRIYLGRGPLSSNKRCCKIKFFMSGFVFDYRRRCSRRREKSLRIGQFASDVARTINCGSNYFWTCPAVKDSPLRSLLYLHDETINCRNRVSDPIKLLNDANFCLKNNFCKEIKREANKHVSRCATSSSHMPELTKITVIVH